MTIARRDAITQKTSFKAALSGTKFRVQPGVTIYTAPSEQACLGIMIPKRFIALSVDRHRLKRRIAASIEPINGLMVVVRVMQKVDAEVDLDPLLAWFEKMVLKVKEGPEIESGPSA